MGIFCIHINSQHIPYIICSEFCAECHPHCPKRDRNISLQQIHGSCILIATEEKISDITHKICLPLVFLYKSS